MSDLLSRAQAFYAAALADPAAAAEQYLSEDFVLENPLPEPIPFGGSYRGREGFLRYLGELAAAIDMGPLQMQEWVADGRTVAVRGRESSRVRQTGRVYEMRFVHWLSFDEDGRLTAMREFNDTAAMRPAFLPEGSGT
jgi:ketosteroid isomerase-like protein